MIRTNKPDIAMHNSPPMGILVIIMKYEYIALRSTFVSPLRTAFSLNALMYVIFQQLPVSIFLRCYML